MRTADSPRRAGGRRSSVAESAYAYLNGRGEPAALDVVVQHALALRGPPPARLVQEISALLGADARFLIDEHGVCSLANWDLGQKSIDEAEFVVFDVESNGGRSGRHRIIELAGVRFNSRSETAEYSSFVRLGRRLPRFISSLTGILPEQLYDAPPVETVLDEFAAFANGAILVSHNLPADLAFLNHEAIWAGRPRFAGDGLDTMELLAGLVPGLKQLGLQAGMKHFGVNMETAHRALPDARNAAELFRRLAEMAKRRGLATVADLRDFAIGAGNRGLPRRRAELARWASLNLPALPGVYVFWGADGGALYVGKSRSLQRRVRSHFTGVRAAQKTWQGLLEATASIDHEVTGSDFSATLLEIERIRELEPVFNVQLRRRSPARFVRLGPEADPVVGCVSEVTDDGAVYAGPYRTAAAARGLAATVRRVFGMPSRRRRFEVESQLSYRAAERFLLRGPKAAFELLSAASDADEAAARRILRRLRRVRGVPNPVAGGLAGVRAIIFDHGPGPDEVELFAIEQGTVIASQRLRQPSRDSVRAAVEKMVNARNTNAQADASSVNSVVAWLHQHFGDDNVAIVRGADDFDRMAARIWRRVRELAFA